MSCETPEKGSFWEQPLRPTTSTDEADRVVGVTGGWGITPSKETQMKITEATLIKRINRRLAHQGEVLRKRRGSHHDTDLGDYYIVDVHRNVVLAGHLDPIALGRISACFAAGSSLSDRRTASRWMARRLRQRR